MDKYTATQRHEDDLIIIRSVLSGDSSQFALLWQKYNKQIFASVLKIVRSIDDADDIVQDTFLKAFNALHSYNQTFPFPAWLYKIASNTCIDYFRRKRIRPISIENINREGGDIYDIISDKSTPIDVNIINNETKEQLLKAVEQLPLRYKQCIQLRHFEELSYEEISIKMDLPLGTVKITLFRARKMLLNMLSNKDLK
ncbi:MAG: RNA polymerase sigma factor [Ignavibacteria bacterium]